jgi:hypothetical protein
LSTPFNLDDICTYYDYQGTFPADRQGGNTGTDISAGVSSDNTHVLVGEETRRGTHWTEKGG